MYGYSPIRTIYGSKIQGDTLAGPRCPTAEAYPPSIPNETASAHYFPS